jgi:succinyl-diaminopimelate desuccinylase
MAALAWTLSSYDAGADRVRRLHELYKARYADLMAQLLCEAIRFPTIAGNAQAFAAQQAWLFRVANKLTLSARAAGPVTEVELAGPAGAPVLGLIVHGDVEKTGDEREWNVPPFAGTENEGYIYGRGAADDKGPMVQSLLAMATIRAGGERRTHTIRLLIGSDEEAGGKDMAAYLKTHRAPDYSLVLDSAFPVVVGEKAWNTYTATAAEPYAIRSRAGATWAVVDLKAGTGPSIVPGIATARLRWLPDDAGDISAAAGALLSAPLPPGFRIEGSVKGHQLTLTMRGRAAHSGSNIEGGRNALVQLAKLLVPHIAASGARDLLLFASETGRDLYGTALGLTSRDPLWGRYAVNVAIIEPADGGKLALTLNLRRTPPWTGPQLRQHMDAFTAAFNARNGSALVPNGYYEEEPLVFDPNAKLVKRLLAAYGRATGARRPPVISGGATYAARVPNSIAFGMWFPDTPYPGHEVDERNSLRHLHEGVNVLIEVLADLASSDSMVDPLRP